MTHAIRPTDIRLGEVIEEFTSSAPVDLHALAAALGIEVVLDRSLPHDVSGKIEQATDRRFRITVNASHESGRRRFTLAHEIAHFALHKDRIGEGIVDNGLYHSRMSDLAEQTATRFALELLMPEPLVRKILNDGAQSIAELMVAFNVPLEAARFRVDTLKLQ
jgi:Zn-dependent peptidase ImmA (M78 family)